jgi:hypothetical protein
MSVQEQMDGLIPTPLPAWAPAPGRGEDPTPPTVLDRNGIVAGVTAWLLWHRRSLGAGVVVLAISAAALVAGLSHYPAFADDEGTYVAQAWAVRTRWALAHYTYWYDHLPAGWLQLALLTVVLRPIAALGGFTANAVTEARLAMMVPALATVALVYVLLRRVGAGRVAAAVGTAAFGLCPLTVDSLRQVYLDGLALPWLVAAFVLAATPRRRLWAFTAAGVCAAVCVLSKETMVIAVTALAVGLWQQSDRRTRAFCLSAFAAAFLLVSLGYPLFALLKGELVPGSGHVSFFEALRFQLLGRDSTGSALNPTSASRRLVSSWLSVDPWLLGAGVVAVPVGLSVRRLRPTALALASFVIVGVRPGYLPEPYVIALLPFTAVTAAGVASWLWPRAVAWLDARDGVWMRTVVSVMAVVAAIVPLSAILPASGKGDHTARAVDMTSSTLTATTWVVGHVDHRARVLVDDTLFVDLANAGFEPGLGVVWFYKMDFATNLDPSVMRALPHGYRDFDYVVSTPVIRSALDQNPGRLEEVRRALASSIVVASFGRDSTLAEVRRIVGPGTGSGRIPGVATHA